MWAMFIKTELNLKVNCDWLTVIMLHQWTVRWVMTGLVAIESVITVPAVSWSASSVPPSCAAEPLCILTVWSQRLGWASQVCTVCVCERVPVNSSPDEFPFPSVHQSVCILRFWKSHSMISSVFSRREWSKGKWDEKEGKRGEKKKPYPFDLAGKNMGSTTESHLLCQLFCRRADIPMGTRFLLRESESDQCGPCLIWPWKQGEMEEGGVLVCGGGVGLHLLPSPGKPSEHLKSKFLRLPLRLLPLPLEL